MSAQFNEKQFDTGNVTLNFVEGPESGSPLVVLHGASANWQNMRPILPALAERWHIYALDLRGHGKSGRVAGRYSLPDYVGDIIKFVHDVVQQRVVLYGHSLGGLVAMGAAAQAPDMIRALVLEDPALVAYTHRPEDVFAHPYFRGVYETLIAAHSIEGITAWLKTINPPGTPDDVLMPWAEMLYSLDDELLVPVLEDKLVDKNSFEATLAQITCPMLLLQADPALGAATEDGHVVTIKAHVTQCTAILMKGADHGIHFSQTAALLENVTRFLEGVEPPTASATQ